ncbi:MAG: hypothetical protein EBQ87_01305, partial [Planctomycetes bacterium]|nr:hypothetical protein [Planctomycetota bacterium]
AVFPRNTGKDEAGKKIQKDKIDKVNSIISKLDDGGKSVKFLDIGSKFKDASGAFLKKSCLINFTLVKRVMKFGQKKLKVLSLRC